MGSVLMLRAVVNPKCWPLRLSASLHRHFFSSSTSIRHSHAASQSALKSSSSHLQNLPDALTTLGLQQYVQDFRGNAEDLQKFRLLVSEEVASADIETLLRTKTFRAVTFENFAAVFNVCKVFFARGECAGNVLANVPGALLQSVEHLERKFKHFDDFQVGKEVLLRHCRILILKEDRIQKSLSFLQDIGLSGTSRNRVIRRLPRVLGYSVENTMQPIVEYLEKRGMDRKTLVCTIVRNPPILGVSISNNLARRFDTLSRLGLTTQASCKAIGYFISCPFRCIRSRIDNLINQGFSDDDVSLLIGSFPRIMTIPEETIKKKVDYVVNVGSRDLKEIVRFPQCLSYSLEKRIIPRFSILKDMGLLSRYSMSRILPPKEEDFMRIPQCVKIIS